MTNQELQELFLSIKNNWLQNWMAEDGLTRLDIEVDYKDPHPPATRKTVRNENGILGTAQVFSMLHALNMVNGGDKKIAQEAIQDLQRMSDGRHVLGCSNRWSCNDERLESHDNTAAIFNLCEIFDLQDEAKNFLLYLVSHGGVSDNTKKKIQLNWPSIKEAFKTTIAAWRQPGEFVLYNMVNNYNPTITQLLWFWVGSRLTLRSDRHYSRNLLWTRLYPILNRMKKHKFRFYVRWVINSVVKDYNKLVVPHQKYFLGYYYPQRPFDVAVEDRPVHPIYSLAPYAAFIGRPSPYRRPE